MTDGGAIEGIILRVRPLTESSLIVCWLTAEHGRISTVAKGARRPKSPYRGKLDLFYSAAFTFRRSRRSELHNLAEVSLLNTRPILRREIATLGKAAYGAQLLELATETDTPLPEIYNLFNCFLEHLSAAPDQPNSVLAFEVKLLEESGFSADAASQVLRPAASDFLRSLGEEEWDGLCRVSVPAQEFRAADNFLRAFVNQHLGRVPRARPAVSG